MNNIIVFFQTYVFNSMLPSFFFMIIILLKKWLCISVYFSFIYFLIWSIKKTKIITTNAQANYYCWYVLLFSFVFANLDINNYFTNLLIQIVYTGKSYSPCAYIAACFMSVLWLVVTIYKIAGYFILNRKIQKSLKYMSLFSDRKNLLLKAKAALSINKKVKVMIADYIDTPVSYGIVVKYILLPNTYEEKYASYELYLMFLHELSHIKNGDTIKFRMLNFMECLMWFNPVIRLFCKNFRQDTEMLCDNQVMSIQNSARETYGHLLLRGCSRQNTIIGYGFSDSYHMIKGRLDALYQYKPLKHNFTAITSLFVLIFMTANSTIHYACSNSLSINNAYSSVFEISLNNSDYTLYEYIDSSLCSKIYEIREYEIWVNKSALRELAEDYSNHDYEMIVIDSKNFIYATNQFIFTNGDSYRISFDEILNEHEGSPYFSFPLSKRHPIEYVFLKIANKI